MTTKLCEFCGKEIPENSKICPYCNKALNNKVFTYMNESKNSDNSRLNVSKFINDDKENKENYFNSNIYSFSEKEIEKRFERKPISYEEEEYKEPQNTERAQRELSMKNPRTRQRKKQKSLIYPIIGVLAAIVIIICIIGFALSGNDKETETVTTTAPISSTTVKPTVTTEETATTTEPTTTTESYISKNSVDLDGYLGVTFSSISADFGQQIQDPANDEFYGGNIYYYDGMTISTDENGRIASMTIDYTTVQNKDTYRYKDITYYSTYNQVIDELGTPDLDQMKDSNEPCIGYTLDEGSGLSIKFKFDDNSKVSGFDMFYSD